MAIYFDKEYLSCSCGNKELILENRLLVEETESMYQAHSNKVLKCASCNKIVKQLDKFNEKPIMEV